MSLEPIGIFTIALGIYCLFAGTHASVIVFITLTVLGAAAAILIGSANIQPAHLFLAFLALSTLTFRKNFAVALDALHFPKPAFWLACLLVYGTAAGFFVPRLLARASDIIPLGVSEYASTGGAVPLGPVSGNFTQAVYLAADLLAFLLIVSIGSTKDGIRTITMGVLAFTGANVAFAILDLITHGTAAHELFFFIRNAQYALHTDDIVANVKRIAGSWPEASAFAGISLASIGFAGTLWLCGRNMPWTAPLFLLSAILVVRSTSSTGLFALPLCLLILYITAVMRSGGASGTRSSSCIVFFAPPFILLAVLFTVLNENLYRQVYAYFDLLLFSKPSSSSAIERGSWNLHGFGNFLDSYGFGVGLGTARTSSFLFALLSNVGIPGTMFFLLFALSAFAKRRGTPRSFASDVRLAARNGCCCLMIGSLVAGPTVDLGLLFFVLAALCCAEPETETIRGPVARHLPAKANRD